MDRLAPDWVVVVLLLVMGLVFFGINANLELASDDTAWLQGEAPTVFDQYRRVPRLFFLAVHTFFGPSAMAALVMIGVFHSLNALLVYHLAGALLEDSLAAKVAMAVFVINPITLSALTWISCFSYVLGTTLALLAVFAFCKGSGSSGRRHAVWSGISMLFFLAGLFSSHEIFFLPAVMVVTSWLRGHLQRGITYFSVGMASALLVNVFVYDFGRFGVEVSRLFSPDFTLAYASSGLSSGLALGLAYPLSFVIKPLEFLRICFSEPARWGLTAVMLGAGIASYREGHAWRLTLALLFSFLACITPYIIRLFLTPATVNYHITYALSGRVFYLPFVIVALAWGRLVSRLYGWIGDRRGARLLWLVPVAAYGYALWYYDRTDFLGLDVARGVLQGAPPRWNPFANPQPVWMILVGLAVITALILRRQAVRGRSGNVVT